MVGYVPFHEFHGIQLHSTGDGAHGVTAFKAYSSIRLPHTSLLMSTHRLRFCVPHFWYMGHDVWDLWIARQSTMTSVSSAVTMTALEPVRAACSACKSKLVSASSCVDCSSVTSTHSSAVIFKQFSSQVTCNALPYSASLYRCSFHQPTKNCYTMLVLLKEQHRNCLHCCMLGPPTRHLYWRVVLSPRFSDSNIWCTAGGICQRPHQPYNSVHPLTEPWTRQILPVVQMFCCCLHHLYQTHPINDRLMELGISFAGDTFFPSSLASAVLFVFPRKPSAFASAHGSGPSGWTRTSFMFALLLLVTRIIWLNRFRCAFRTTFWSLIRDVFVLIVENVFSLWFVIFRGIPRMVDHRLIWSI